MSTKKKMLQAAAGNAGGGATDDDFNTVSFLSHFDGDNNGVNSVFEDSSSNDSTMTVTGSVTQGSFTPFSKPEGEWGVAFDAGDYLTLSTNIAASGAFIVEAWVFKTTSAKAQIFSSNSVSFNRQFSISADQKINLYDGSSEILSTGTISLGAWHHVLVSRSGSTIYFFIDGVAAGTASTSATFYFGDVGGLFANGTGIGCLSNVRLILGSSVTSAFDVPTEPLTAISGTAFLGCQDNRFKDNSTNGYTLTATATPEVTRFSPFASGDAYDPAVNGGSAYFDGVGDYLSTPNSGDWQLGDGEFTIEAWIYVKPSGSVKQSVIGHWTNSSRGWQARIEPSGNGYKLRWTWTTDGSNDISRTGSIVAEFGSWNHVAWVRSGSNVTLYVNGVAGGSYAGANIYAPSTPLLVGDWDSNAADFLGYMSDVRLVKGTAVYTSNFTPPTEPLTAVTNTKLLLNMDNAQAIDSAAQNNLRFHGTAKTSTAQSKFGASSLLLDGNSDLASFVHSEVNDISGPRDWTVEFFWRFVDNDATSIQELVTKGNGFQIYTASGALAFALSASNNSTYFINTTGGTTLSDGVWYHIAAVKNGTDYSVYLDGTKETNLGGTSSSNVDTGTSSWNLGAFTSNSYFANGYMDEVRISQFARYTANFTPPTEPFGDKGS